MAETPWQFWVDRGGTFTDVIARAPGGAVHQHKLLSEDPAYRDAAVEAMRRIAGDEGGALPPIDLRIGTTVATNALLERKGEPTCLAITGGFGDALAIGTQERPELFVREIRKPEPLYAHVVEIDERLGADGEVLRPLDEAAAFTALKACYDKGCRAIAIVLMHGWRYPGHEDRLAAIAQGIGFTQVSAGHDVAPLIKLIGRGDTTVVDAYLSPVVRRYAEALVAEAGGSVAPLFMQSSGGLAAAGAFHGKDAVLSGPAGGIVGMAATAAEAGFGKVIGFDMGGTSTDVSHYAGSYERDSENRVAGVRIRTPMMRIHTVAAGGGSICAFDGTRLTVGPHSAGAIPGPACYRRGGPLTVTDCNLLTGKLVPAHFPALFGPKGDQPLDRDVVEAKFADLAHQVAQATGREATPEQLAEGCIAIAVANMVNAIKAISVRRGHDVAGYTLCCFGGAGGQHACLVADALGMDRVMIHPLAGVLSAYGIGLADRSAVREKTLGLDFEPGAMEALRETVAELGDDAERDLRRQGVTGEIELEAAVQMRTRGGDSTIEVALGAHDAMQTAFDEAYRKQFGFRSDDALVIDTLRVEAVRRADPDTAVAAELPERSGDPLEVARCFMGGEWRNAPLYDRARLAAGFALEGPAIVIDPTSTTVVEPGWGLEVDQHGNLILDRVAPRDTGEELGTAVDPVRLEIMGGLFMAIAEEMGAALQHSASSVNIRERLDFSCAVFDAAGNLVANAPHMPVHLGSMGESVRTIMARRGEMRDGRGIRPGDVYALNAPYDGGTHLPDITVVMPVFVAPGDPAPAYFVAARGHHADIGGITPGSMPPMSTSVEQEGVLIDNVLIVEDGEFLAKDLRALLSSGPYPSRNVAANLADLKAQVAACTKGADELRRISHEYGREGVAAYMGHVQAHAEEAVRKLIDRIEDGSFRYEMDNGAVVAVRVTVDRESRSATVDFAGTSDQLPGNFNAPVSVVRAAVLYVVRTLIDDAIPMNEGCLRPIAIRVPEGSMLRPRHPAAVVAGNVETSQVVTDALFGALGAMAGAQGTMNNFTFGNERHQYYETIAGGSGAGPDFDGADVVQTHMTNSRLTDPEILETRFPVRLEEFAIRRGSGGAGAHRGGDGAVRRVRFLESMTAGILANRRRVPPFGLAGGADGACGINRIERADGSVEELEATASAEMQPGDVFAILTPGGGGYGEA